MRYLTDNGESQPFLAFALLVAISTLTPGLSRQAQVPTTPAGISQLVERRAGRVSCWGVVINLGNSRFKKRIDPREIEIREAKHGHDLTGTMNWKVEQRGKKIVIKFKPGMGDFGTGNRVEIRIKRSAFLEPLHLGNDYFQWVIDTDVL
jgi:hypothetical protein